MNKQAHNYIFEYYDAITSGRIRAGKWIKAIYKILVEGIKNGEWVFDQKKANKAIKFIENYCHHSEGRNDLLKLELWQKAIVSAIFGILDKNTGYRQFREVFLVVARKNGKTLFAAAIMAYMAYIDGEYGAKLYCLAPKLEQADLAYDAFYQIVQQDEELSEISKKRRSDIYIQEFNTTIKKIAFNSKKSDGFNPHFVLNDEMEAWPGDQGLKQYDVMASALGARKQPLILSTSTAGYENDGIYDELMKRSTAFLKGRGKGDTEKRLLPFLFIIDDVEKWDTREELEKSNPNLGVSVSWEYYEDKIAVAKKSLAAKAEFLTKFCNIKQNSSIAWLDYVDVERAAGQHFTLEDFRGCYCVAGIDLSRTTDLTAASLIIEKDGKNYVITKFFMPRERFKVAINEENVPYNIFEQQGFGYSDIVREKITAYAEEPEEMQKLTDADYDGVVEESVTRAIKRYASRQILVGPGGTGKFRGIFFNPAKAADDIIDRNTDITTITTIADDTLDEIIYSFGGDEDVEDIAVLILNKKDLKKFAKLRDKQGRKVYTIVNHGNTGTIDEVPYIINSACGEVGGTAGAYCMAYGPLSNYEVAIFSDIDAQKSTEYKFKQGQIAYKACVFMGGNVVAKNGFIRVKNAQA